MPQSSDNSDPEKAVLVLLKILKCGEQQIQGGKLPPAADVLRDLRRQKKST